MAQKLKFFLLLWAFIATVFGVFLWQSSISVLGQEHGEHHQKIDFTKQVTKVAVDEYEVTINVYDKNIKKNASADVVLILDVSDNMDLDINGNSSNSHMFQGQSRWELLKKSMDVFIDAVVMPHGDVRVAIIAYGGYTGSASYNSRRDHQVIMDFSNNATKLKNSYKKYSCVAQSNISEGTSLRKDFYPGSGDEYADSNGYAGIYGAKELFAGSSAVSKTAILLAGSEVNKCYTKNGKVTSIDAVKSTINKANDLKSAYNNIKIYTVGLGADASFLEFLNPVYVDKIYQEAFYTAADKTTLNEVFALLSQDIVVGGIVVGEIGEGFSVINKAFPNAAQIDVGGNVMWPINNLSAKNQLKFTVKIADDIYGIISADNICSLVFTCNKCKTTDILRCDTPAILISPKAVNDEAIVPGNAPTFIDIMANDTQIANKKTLDGTEISDLSVNILIPPSNGAISIDDNVVAYTPHNNFSGSDSFSYNLTAAVSNSSEGEGATLAKTLFSNTAIVQIAVDGCSKNNTASESRAMSTEFCGRLNPYKIGNNYVSITLPSEKHEIGDNSGGLLPIFNEIIK